jgi:hypothetical protein
MESHPASIPAMGRDALPVVAAAFLLACGTGSSVPPVEPPPTGGGGGGGGGGITSSVAPPVFSPSGGTFTDSVTFTLSSPDPGAVIHYSTVPGLDRPDWPLLLDRTTTIEAMACNDRACAAPVRTTYTF